MKVRNIVGTSVAAGALLLAGFAGSASAVQPFDNDGLGPIVPAAAGTCDDAGQVTWSANDPDRYGTAGNEVTVGNSNVNRSVTVTLPEGCEFDQGDRWRVYNGYFSAEGYISSTEDDQRSNTDGSVVFETPDSNTVAGDELVVRANFKEAAETTWGSSDTSEVPLVLVRRTIFKTGSTDNRINFTPEPYNPSDHVHSTGNLLRADWTNNDYDGYDGRTVSIQTRVDGPNPPNAYSTSERVVTANGGQVRSHLVVADAAGEPDGGNIIVRASYGGNGTSSGNVSTGDRLLAVS